jgi:small subunit ribosomal protein S16
MAVKIRLARRGRKKKAIYDIVIADARAPRDGRFIEKIGQYDPNSTPAGVMLRNERALHWLMVGAQPTDTTRKILSVEGAMLQKHLQVGVVKGAITQEVADERYNKWIEEKAAAREEKIAKLSGDKDAIKRAALEAEKKKKDGMIAAKAKVEADLIAAAEAEEKAAADAKAAAEAPVVIEQETPAAEEAPAETATEEATDATPADAAPEEEAKA